MNEIFRDVVGFEGKYKVSNFGNVLSLNYQNTNTEKMLVPLKHHGGYLIVHLGKSRVKSIHVLVAEAFLPNPEGKKCVNHIDGNKHNNCVKNLEWATHKENTAHAIRTGLRNPHFNNAKRGKENAQSKAVCQYSTDGTLLKVWECISDAARAVGCNPCQIVSVATGRTKTCHGFVWRYSIE
jgi:hypothetical protein